MERCECVLCCIIRDEQPLCKCHIWKGEIVFIELTFNEIYTFWPAPVSTHHSVYLLFYLFQEDGDPPVNESLSIENTLWASTVVASGKYEIVVAALYRRELIPRKLPGPTFALRARSCTQTLFVCWEIWSLVSPKTHTHILLWGS